MARYIIKLEHTDIEVDLKVIRLQVRKQGRWVKGSNPPNWFGNACAFIADIR